MWAWLCWLPQLAGARETWRPSRGISTGPARLGAIFGIMAPVDLARRLPLEPPEADQTEA
ncbi:MAG: hypothetical protein ACYTES_17655 [Planctomycetota bacterium]